MNPEIIPFNNRSADSGLIRAQVTAVTGDRIVIDTDIGIATSSTAFSCLVSPQPGDTVLVNYSGDGYYILAILERPDSQDMALDFPADVKMKSPSGKIDLVAGKDINLLSACDTHMLSDNLHVNSGNLDVTTGKLTSRSREIEAHTGSLGLFTRSLNLVAKEITQKTDMLVRWVENVETLNIGNLIQNVRRNYTSHSDQAVITATKDMRIDGERIHMG